MVTRTRTFAMIFSFALTLAPVLAAEASTTPPMFPTGCWTANANGQTAQICIPSLEPDGSFAGTMVFEGYTNAITGLWASGAQQLSFLRLGIPDNPLTYQAFTGFLFPADSANPTGPQMLSGSFSVYGPGGGAVQSRNLFGWVASHQ